MQTGFLQLNRANRIERELQLQMAPEHVYRFADDYTYIEIPLWKILDSEGEIVDKASRNQYVELVSAAHVTLRYGAKLLVAPNPVLFKYGVSPSLLLVDGKQPQILTIPITLRKDLKLDALDYLLRIYLPA